MRALELTLVDAARVQVEWSVDGELVDGFTGGRLDAAATVEGSGQHEVSARVYDPTALVRGSRDGLEQVVKWTLTVP